MTGRYGGLRHFGKIYGMIASITALGAGIGPPLAGIRLRPLRQLCAFPRGRFPWRC